MKNLVENEQFAKNLEEIKQINQEERPPSGFTKKDLKPIECKFAEEEVMEKFQKEEEEKKVAEQVQLEESLKEKKEVGRAAEVPGGPIKATPSKTPKKPEPTGPNPDDEFKEEMERMYMQREDKLSQ